MNIKAVVPSWTEVGRETLIVLGGAILAAAILSQFPSVKKWVKENLY